MNIDLDPLGHAIMIATEAHWGQTDKGGQPYILHPLRVMAGMNTQKERIVAVLHDVIEDADTYSIDQATADFGIDVAMALDAITKRDGEPYSDYLARVGTNLLATVVKLADLEDNSDLKRLRRPPTASDLARVEKYTKARQDLFATFAAR